jgi:hypothetical protein
VIFSVNVRTSPGRNFWCGFLIAPTCWIRKLSIFLQIFKFFSNAPILSVDPQAFSLTCTSHFLDKGHHPHLWLLGLDRVRNWKVVVVGHDLLILARSEDSSVRDVMLLSRSENKTPPKYRDAKVEKIEDSISDDYQRVIFEHLHLFN